MAQRDTNQSTSILHSMEVIEELSAHLDTDPTELNFTLNDYVDPEALDDVLDSSADEIVVAFSIEDLLITVGNDGVIDIVEQEEKSP